MGLSIDLKSQRRGSNPRPTDYKSVALPTELRWHSTHSARSEEREFNNLPNWGNPDLKFCRRIMTFPDQKSSQGTSLGVLLLSESGASRDTVGRLPRLVGRSVRFPGVRYGL